ncbi:hypothetical protein GCM10009069_27480 [Algimonas arctica]|uniref:Uncharacterized protein n=1 Tax=Algimonas arctica TaxID=1479486 RepID=A0A8J3CUK8_9PROT|nr:hypothetical protein [Algimonas arctica]GHB03290.1 hypothetical protein GCM10009069_27480 [Algimonas arctica]
MELPRYEIAFRKQYEPLVLNGSLTVVFRPSNRIFPNRRGYILGETISARIIEKIGCDETGFPPIFNDRKIGVTVSSIRVMNLNELTAKDFEGSSPDVHDIHSLERHLENIYKKSMDFFDRKVTKIELSYLTNPLLGNKLEHESDAL